MADFLPITGDLVWPLVISIAWIAGELGHRWFNLPRISIYGIVGFLFARAPIDLLGDDSRTIASFLANVAFGLMLFEFGYRINLHWLRVNLWLSVSGLFETVLTFFAIYFVAIYFSIEPLTAFLLSSLAISTSPAAIMHIINEQRASGQVTERILHLSVISCVLSVFLFKVALGVWNYQSSGSFYQAAWSGLVSLVVAGVIGALFGVVVPAMLRSIGNVARDATLAFVIAVILLVTLAVSLKLSPVVASLSFGLLARHRRIVFSQTQKNFGALGGLLTILLFVYVALVLNWQQLVAGAAFGVVLIGVRLVTKILGGALFARASGITWRKGMLSGIALMPISVFVVLLLEQTREQGIDLLGVMTPLLVAALLLETLGSIATQWALIWAKETPDKEEQ